MKNFSSFKRLLICVLFFTAFASPGVMAQSIVASGYSFSASTRAYTDIFPSGTATTAIEVDDAFATVSIGFNFTFCGTVYSDVTICSNGWLRFGTGAGSAVSNWNYNHQVNSGVYPCVYALYEDISLVGGTSRHIVTGTAGNRIFKWECRNVLWDYAASTPCVSFQVWLYEATGVIECIYRQENGSVSVGSSGGATIGIANSSTDWQTLNDAISNPTSSSSTYTYNITSRPATGQVYKWDPGPACPAPSGLTITRVNSTTVDFSWGAASGSVGYEYIVDQNPVPPSTSTPSFTSGTSASKTGLTPSSAYYIHLRTKCGATNFSTWVTLPFNTLPPCVIANPPGIIVTKLDTASASLAWAPVGTAVDYEYILKEDNTTPTSSNGTTVTGNTLADFNPLVSGKTYYFFLRVRCDGGDTSDWMLDSIYVPVPCHAPIVKFEGINTNRVVAYWAAPLTAYEYEIIASTTQLSNPTIGIKRQTNNYLIPFLDEGTTYYVYARSYCDDRGVKSVSDWSQTSVKTWALGVNEVASNAEVLTFYPNPVSGQLFVSINTNTTEGGELSVSDMTGRVLEVIPVKGKNVVVNAAGFPSGLYILNYSAPGMQQQVKFTKL